MLSHEHEGGSDTNPVWSHLQVMVAKGTGTKGHTAWAPREQHTEWGSSVES